MLVETLPSLCGQNIYLKEAAFHCQANLLFFFKFYVSGTSGRRVEIGLREKKKKLLASLDPDQSMRGYIARTSSHTHTTTNQDMPQDRYALIPYCLARMERERGFVIVAGRSTWIGRSTEAFVRLVPVAQRRPQRGSVGNASQAFSSHAMPPHQCTAL